MNVLIREAHESDVSAIWKLNALEMGYQYPLDATIQKMNRLLNSKTDKIYVAVSEETVVGYIHANDYDAIYAPHMKNIMGIAVLSSHKHHGIGKALLQQVEEWAHSTGAAGVRLVSGMTRTEAHMFYHSCGYAGDKKQLNLKKMF
ncbi:MAG: GNAT family N-acetyltransferase [Oscillospiraceae bacterium]|nr:GNAT family N-acetyltransferase [Oscillospiraceae bacterium]